MFKSKRIVRQNMAIKESAEIIIGSLVYGNSVTESMLAETYSANLKKHGFSSGANFDLIELLNGTILHLQQSVFLTSEQKEKYRARLSQTINDLKNPFGKIDFELEDLLDKTSKINERLDDEAYDKNDIKCLVTKLEDNIKKIRLGQYEPKKDNIFAKAFLNLLCFSGKTIFYGIALNTIIILSMFAYDYFVDPQFLEMLAQQ